MIAAIGEALDALEASEGPGALVMTGDGKFFSNGLDLEWMDSVPACQSEETLRSVHGLFARLLAFPTPTVAAINGHAFAAGAMLALACDQRVMRVDRGFICVPEVDIGLPFTPGMTGLLKAQLSPATAREAMFTGRRYGGDDALLAGIVDAAVAEGQVVAAASERAAANASKPRTTLATIKRGFYADVLATLQAS